MGLGQDGAQMVLSLGKSVATDCHLAISEAVCRSNNFNLMNGSIVKEMDTTKNKKENESKSRKGYRIAGKKRKTMKKRTGVIPRNPFLVGEGGTSTAKQHRGSRFNHDHIAHSKLGRVHRTL